MLLEGPMGRENHAVLGVAREVSTAVGLVLTCRKPSLSAPICMQ